eukprot:2922288-Amphidinium_carterae.4
MSEDSVPSGLDFPIASGIMAYLCVYVDDLLLTAEDEVHDAVMSQLRETWKTSEPKVLGRNCDSLVYLGVVVCYESEGSDVLLIHQIPYVSDLLDKYRDWIPLKTITQPSPPESFADSAAEREETVTEDQIATMRAILGAVLWLVTRTRPDLAWSHSMCATTLVSNSSECLKRVRQLLGYLQDYNCVALNMTPQDDKLVVCTDISFAAGGNKSHSGVLLQYGNASLTWRSHKQSIVALSTGEAELYACIEGLSVIRAAKTLLVELGENIPICQIMCDNTAAIVLSNSDPPMRSRHWSIRAWRLREAVRSGEIHVQYIATSEQRADSFTKSLSCQALAEHRDLMGLVEIDR